MRDSLGFVPGEYAFTVEGIAYVQPADGQTPSAHTYTETTTLHVGISQVTTAFAAFIGALLAYLVVALQPGQDLQRWKPDSPVGHRFKAAAVVIRNAFSAGLLGSTVTIVASRLSETQFPVKVSVNDFWGALTIGFVAYFAGAKFIATVAGRFASSTGPSPVTPAPTTPAPSSASGGQAEAVLITADPVASLSETATGEASASARSAGAS